MSSACCGSAIMPTACIVIPVALLDVLGERHLVARRRPGSSPAATSAAARDADVVAADALRARAHRRPRRRCPRPPSTQSLALMRAPSGPLARPDVAHGVERPRAGSACGSRAAAVGVVALVGERREELVQQVAVRRMQLDARRSRCRFARCAAADEGIDAALRISAVRQRLRRRASPRRTASPRARRSCQRRLRRREPLAALPRHLRRGLAAGVRELDADRRSATARRQASITRFDRRFVVLAVEAGAAVRDAAFARHARGLDDQQPGARVARAGRGGRGASRSSQPSSAEYWHIGETTMRLGSVMPPSSSGVKSSGCGNFDVLARRKCFSDRLREEPPRPAGRRAGRACRPRPATRLPERLVT